MDLATYTKILHQGTFSVYEKFKMVEEFVSDSLEHPLPFILHDSVSSGQVLENENFAPFRNHHSKSMNNFCCVLVIHPW